MKAGIKDDQVKFWEKLHWVPFHTRQRILSAIALTVEELGIGDALKNAVQSGPGPLIVKVCINTKKI